MASRSVNKCILLGHLTRDAETKSLQSGTSVSTLGVATSHRYKDKASGEWKDDTTFHDVVIWNSDNVAAFLTKGKQVYIEGRISKRSFEGKDGTKQYRVEVVANELILLGGRSDGGGNAPAGQPSAPVSHTVDDSDLPF